MTEADRILVAPSDMIQIPLWEVDEEGRPKGSLAAYVSDDPGEGIAYVIFDALPRELVSTTIADDGVARIEMLLSAKRFSELTDKFVEVSNRLDSGLPTQ